MYIYIYIYINHNNDNMYIYIYIYIYIYRRHHVCFAVVAPSRPALPSAAKWP